MVRKARQNNHKSGQIVSALRQDILRGRYKPGGRFPTRADLEKRFGTTRATVQKALDRLVSDGFVYARGRTGTYVSERPPHLCNYGLVFADRPQPDAELSRFYGAIRNEAVALERADSIRFTSYVGIRGGPQSEGWQRLADDAGARRLAGIIYTFPPDHFGGLLDAAPAGIPKVAVMDAAGLKGVHAVYPDGFSFVDRALDYLVSRSRTRIAIVTVPHFRAQWRSHFEEGLSGRGMRTSEPWTHAVGLEPAERPWVRNIVHLLMTTRGEARPDGLIVADDNFVEHASAGLVAAGVRVGEDLDVVAHCNFPWPPPSVLPLKRLGFDVRRLVQACVESVDRIRRRGKMPGSTRIPAVFEDEVVVHTNEARGGY